MEGMSPMMAHILPAFKLLYEDGIYNSGLAVYSFASWAYRISATIAHISPGRP